MGTRRDVASRRSTPSGHVATTTRQRGPFSRCHKVPFLLAISTCVPFSTVGPPTTPSALTPQVGGIIIPDTAKEKPQQGQVLAVGKGKVRDDGGE